MRHASLLDNEICSWHSQRRSDSDATRNPTDSVGWVTHHYICKKPSTTTSAAIISLEHRPRYFALGAVVQCGIDTVTEVLWGLQLCGPRIPHTVRSVTPTISVLGVAGARALPTKQQ